MGGSDVDFDTPEQSSYTADPEPGDLAKPQAVTNLSPGCARKAGFCSEFDLTTLLELDPDFFVVQGYAENGDSDPFPNFAEVELIFGKERTKNPSLESPM